MQPIRFCESFHMLHQIWTASPAVPSRSAIMFKKAISEGHKRMHLTMGLSKNGNPFIELRAIVAALLSAKVTQACPLSL